MAVIIEGCACGEALGFCPRCGEAVCLACEDWHAHHSFRARFGRLWRRYVSKYLVA